MHPHECCCAYLGIWRRRFDSWTEGIIVAGSNFSPVLVTTSAFLPHLNNGIVSREYKLAPRPETASLGVARINTPHCGGTNVIADD